jgi:hypothetical protein
VGIDVDVRHATSPALQRRRAQVLLRGA